MKCIKAQRLMSPYLKNQLSNRELKAFLDHVEHCPDCYDELKTLCIVYEVMAEDDPNLTVSQRNLLTENIHERIEKSRNHLKRIRFRNFCFGFFIFIVEMALLIFAYSQYQLATSGDSFRNTSLYQSLYQNGKKKASGTEIVTEKETENEKKTETETEVKSAGKTEQKAEKETKAATKTETKSETKTETKSETKTETKSETKSKTKTETEMKSASEKK